MRTSPKSPVNRIGGKYFLSNWLVQHIPDHITYVELFVGAGHLLFAKSKSQVEVINDIDRHLVTFFEVIKDHAKRQRLTEILQYMPYSRSLWQEIRTKWREGKIPGDEIERVSWWFYLNKTCFSGDQMRGGFAVPSITGRNPVQNFRNSIDTFEDVAERLRNVCIESLHYAKCLSLYDSPETFFYCDPPYLDAEHYYGKANFAYDDHHVLAELLHGVKAKVMITHYQNGLYDDLYKGWYRYEFYSFKGSHKAGTGEEKPKTTEVLYCNFKPQRNRSLFND